MKDLIVKWLTSFPRWSIDINFPIEDQVPALSFVALTGVGVPMGLSFTLTRIASATLLQAFAAGASLCSTSIGATFTVFSNTGLAKARLGVVLSGTAMIDDVSGLMMVQVISNPGGSGGSLKALTVIRPIFVAIGFAVAATVRRLRTSMTYMPHQASAIYVPSPHVLQNNLKLHCINYNSVSFYRVCASYIAESSNQTFNGNDSLSKPRTFIFQQHS